MRVGEKARMARMQACSSALKGRVTSDFGRWHGRPCRQLIRIDAVSRDLHEMSLASFDGSYRTITEGAIRTLGSDDPRLTQCTQLGFRSSVGRRKIRQTRPCEARQKPREFKARHLITACHVLAGALHLDARCLLLRVPCIFCALVCPATSWANCSTGKCSTCKRKASPGDATTTAQHAHQHHKAQGNGQPR